MRQQIEGMQCFKCSISQIPDFQSQQNEKIQIEKELKIDKKNMENLLYNEKALETSSCFIMIYGNLPLYSHFSVSRPNNWNGVGCALRIFLFFFSSH